MGLVSQFVQRKEKEFFSARRTARVSTGPFLFFLATYDILKERNSTPAGEADG
jgi:hypothetical protein